MEAARLVRAAIVVNIAIPLAEFTARTQRVSNELDSFYSLTLRTLDKYINLFWRETNGLGDFLCEEANRFLI